MSDTPAKKKPRAIPKPDHERIIQRWIEAANAKDKEKYLAFFTEDAVLDDPSVGRKFEGRGEIGEYFDAYFIGYATKTRLLSIAPDGGHLHVQVHFTGEFPGGSTGGIFDLTFAGEQISFVHADLADD